MENVHAGKTSMRGKNNGKHKINLTATARGIPVIIQECFKVTRHLSFICKNIKQPRGLSNDSHTYIKSTLGKIRHEDTR